MIKIDSHNHILFHQIPNFKEKFGTGGFIQFYYLEDGYVDMVCDDGKFFCKVEFNCFSSEKRLEEMDQFNVDVQVLSTVFVMFSEWAKFEQT